jgi:tripartite-type tricarboxylate transporter receptor subunit TctC
MYPGFVFATALLAAVPAVALAQADGFPNKPVRFIVPFAAGGAVDILTRTVGQKLSDTWGQPVLVENRPGAGGTIGAGLAARATADGYTVLMGDAAHANAIWLYKKLSYNFVKDFEPVTLAAITPLVVVAHPSLPVKSTRELIQLARSSKEPLLLGTGGNGSATDLGAELLMATAKIKFSKVAYKSVPPALPDLISGRLSLMFLPAPVAMQPVRDKRVNAIAVTSAQRVNAYAGVPAIAEELPGFEANTWYGMMVPAKTPPALINRLHRDITAALKNPEVRDRLTGLGSQLVAGTPAEFASHIRLEIDKWGKVIHSAGIQIE